jgi:hypothetical protein
MATGPRDTTSLVMLSGWDATELQNYQLQDGTTFGTVVGEMNAALTALNAELYSDPLWASAISFTDIPEIEYRDGASNGMEIHTEYGRPDAKRAATQGHMLPLVAYDRMLGWTWDYLRKARMSQIEADIADGIKDVRDQFRKAVLTRALQRIDDSGVAKGLGTGGYSPGFCTTAGSTGVDFVPPSFGGASFANTHEHYIATSASGSYTVAIFQAVRAHLREHGHQAPYEMWIGPGSEVAVKALTGFVPVQQWGINYSSTVSTATGLNGDIRSLTGAYYIGVLEEMKVMVVPGIPLYYGFAYKSYGQNSSRNPFKVRLQKGQMRPQAVAMPNPNSAGRYPLQDIMLFAEFGVGVNDRTAGSAQYNNNGTWADGVAT